VRQLRRLYKEHRIVFKKLKYCIYHTEAKQQEIAAKLSVSTAALLKLFLNDKRIIFIDEVTFSSKTRMDKAFSLSGQPMLIEKKKLWYPVVAAVGAIDS